MKKIKKFIKEKFSKETTLANALVTLNNFFPSSYSLTFIYFFYFNTFNLILYTFTAVAVLIVRFYGHLRWNNTGAKEQQNQLHQNGGNRIILKLL